MKNPISLFVSHDDYEKLVNLLPNADPELADLLEAELNRATLVPADQLPKDTVAMNSTAQFLDLDTATESTVTLVYPHDADVASKKVSILAPVGAALIGLRVGQEIDWPLPNGRTKRIRVIQVWS